MSVPIVRFVMDALLVVTFMSLFLAGATIIAIDMGAFSMPRDIAVNLGDSATRLGMVVLIVERFNKWLGE